jgi:hypothetical protein
MVIEKITKYPVNILFQYEVSFGKIEDTLNEFAYNTKSKIIITSKSEELVNIAFSIFFLFAIIKNLLLV